MTGALRVMSYNIRYGGVRHESELAAVLNAAAADVVLLQEAVRPDVVGRLASSTRFPYVGSRLGQSTAFMSRVPIAAQTWHKPRGARHPFLELVLDGTDARIFALHLSAWVSNCSERR